MFIAIYGNLKHAMICLIAAGICDLFDGVIARRCKRSYREQEFGVQIDSLIDVVSFLVFPIVLCFAYAKGAWQIMCVAAAVLYCICGVIRLAWFNMHASASEPTLFYTGLPVTYAALVLPVFYLITVLAAMPAFSFIIAYPILAILFISPLKIPKPRGIWYCLFPLTAVAVGVALAVT